MANGVLAGCQGAGGKDCEGKAVRIANSKFDGKIPFNPVLTPGQEEAAMRKAFDEMEKMDPEVRAKMKKCLDSGGSFEDCKKKMTPPEKKEMGETGEVEMEIFRPGNHNGDTFTEEDLLEIAENFEKLKDEVRPKLKLTHRENQETLGGLMSYGDVVGVFLRALADGTRRLFARVANVPKQVLDYIREHRFPERSIEIYPKFRLGTKDSPEYRNVLKAIALLGHEMPAVTGMEPVKLAEALECQGTVCFRQCECDEAEEVPEGLALAFEMLQSDVKSFSSVGNQQGGD